jgi:hypothetical protein
MTVVGSRGRLALPRTCRGDVGSAGSSPGFGRRGRRRARRLVGALRGAPHPWSRRKRATMPSAGRRRRRQVARVPPRGCDCRGPRGATCAAGPSSPIPALRYEGHPRLGAIVHPLGRRALDAFIRRADLGPVVGRRWPPPAPARAPDPLDERPELGILPRAESGGPFIAPPGWQQGDNETSRNDPRQQSLDHAEIPPAKPESRDRTSWPGERSRVL